MRTMLILVAALSLSFMAGDKDKYELKDGLFTKNGSPVFRLEHQGGCNFDFKFKTLEGKDVAFLKFRDFNDKDEITKSNPQGRVTFFDITFLESGLKCEITGAHTKKSLARELHRHDLVFENTVNAEAIKNFVLINGTTFSERMRRGTTVIINN